MCNSQTYDSNCASHLGKIIQSYPKRESNFMYDLKGGQTWGMIQ